MASNMATARVFVNQFYLERLPTISCVFDGAFIRAYLLQQRADHTGLSPGLADVAGDP